MGETKGRFCSKHKEEGMIDIVHPHCKVEGCTTLASFNVSGHSRGEYCSQHKLEGMVNVKHRQCAEPGCSTRPAFNWKGEEKGQFCNKHKEKGMINVDRKDARPEEGAEGPRKRGKGSHAMQAAAQGEQQQQHADYENVARLAQLPDMATLASADANGFVGMHGMPYGHIPQSYAAQSSLGGDPNHSLGPPLQLGGHHLPHQLDGASAASHPHGVVTVADMSQAVWSPQQDPHPAVLALHHAAALHSAEALPPQQVSPQVVVGPPLQEGNPGEPSLPSPEHLRTQVSQGKPSFAVASPSGTLGHVMLSHVIKFAREVMNPPAAGLLEDVHARLCRYIDLFTVWDESKRVEQYSMLHFDWSVAKDGKVQAVLDRIDKVLATV
ncbi:hypothetical protein WJX75_001977 [Coccomyxa subellipsoidea]|uniref:EsV-1-7 n=1 Tax=Coccomyxa subellipsoidea TaxID=248742 RepID=A0ABR2Z2J4_9CHLO